jgi:N-acetylglucosamine-6-phosphate deacetylase
VIVLSGADVVLPDRILPGSLVIEGDRIVDIRHRVASGFPRATTTFALHNHYLVPGFIDAHVHGVGGVDTLGADDSIAAMAAKLPRHGVTAFSPTTVACSAGALRRVLEQVRHARQTPAARSARVLPAHLESNFINARFAGAQPAARLQSPRQALASWAVPGGDEDEGAAVLREIEHAAPDVGTVTVAPELDGGLDLVAWLVARGHRVSVGHSGASYDEALTAIAAGVRQATHLFNCMPPLGHREPGLVGAILQTDEVAAEIICDGFHVHPALVRATVAAKGASRVIAITDGTALSGMPAGTRARLGEQTIVAGESAAHLADGTLAGSILTMDRAFRALVEHMGFSPVVAAAMCATTPAREMGLVGHGVLAEGAVADLVVLDAQLLVVQTYLGGQLVYARSA